MDALDISAGSPTIYSSLIFRYPSISATFSVASVTLREWSSTEDRNPLSSSLCPGEHLVHPVHHSKMSYQPSRINRFLPQPSVFYTIPFTLFALPCDAYVPLKGLNHPILKTGHGHTHRKSHPIASHSATIRTCHTQLPVSNLSFAIRGLSGGLFRYHTGS